MCMPPFCVGSRYAMTENPTTTRKVSTIIEMFADATTGESYAENRLMTRETESGNVALIGYGWQTLAEYDETEDQVTVFFGHKGVSKTATRWLNKILSIAAERRNVQISHESPVVRDPPKASNYIGEYVRDFKNMSPVEETAVAIVERSLRFL